MKIGLTLHDPRRAVADAQRAEELGFDYLGSGEHLFFHVSTPNSFALLAAAAGATSRVQLVSTVALLPLYPAPLAAKLAVTLDLVSGGRFELGVGAGGEYPAEFEACGVDPATRFRRVDEGLAVIRRLFTGERVSFRGEFTQLADVALDPPPVRPGGPPIWLGGRKSGAIRRAGRYADVWMPYMVDPERFATSLRAVRESAAEHGRRPTAVTGALFLWACVDADGDWARQTGVEAVSRTYHQDFAPLADRYLLLGKPSDAARRLEEFASAGVRTVMIQVAVTSERDRERVVRTLAEEVLPQVRD